MRRLNQLSCLALGLCLMVLASPSFGWGTEGHQVIAALAEAQLTPAARKQVDRLLALEPGTTLVSISTWADEHRNPATAPWHYLNFPRGSCEYKAERDCPDGKCVVDVIGREADALKYEVAPEKQLVALKYLVHFVGDVHQPLHAGFGDDRGGNSYQLQAFMRGTNLHALWDTVMIRSLAQDGLTLTNRLQSHSNAELKAKWSAAQAAQESCQIVSLPGFYPDRQVGMDYVEKFQPVLERRLITAGSRLAQLLNDIWK